MRWKIYLSFRSGRKHIAPMVYLLSSTLPITAHGKNGNSRFIPHTTNSWPCDLLIVIANVREIGNWTFLNWNGNPLFLSGILISRTSCPLNYSTIIVASIKLFINFVTASLVSLHSFGQFRLLNINITEQGWTANLCDSIFDKFNEFRNSTG